MLLWIRSSLFYVGYIASLILVGIISLPLLLLPTKIAAPIVIQWNYFVLLWLRICCGVRYQVKGNLKPIVGPCVIVANHQSPWETIFLQCQFYPLTTVLKRELLRIPFFGWGMRILKPIAIDRSNPIQALKQIKKVGCERLQQQQNVLIFPEGTRQPVADLGNFARSGADIAKLADVPIIIVAHNAGYYWPNKQWIKHPGTVELTISEPMAIGDNNTKQLMLEVKQWVADALAESNQSSKQQP